MASPRAQLEAIFRAALRAVDPAACVRASVSRRGAALALAGEALPAASRVAVLAAGKAACGMAAALETVLGERIVRGLAVTKDGHAAPLARIAVREAGHPVPDARSEAAAREALALARETRPRDVLVVLLSGGASSLLSCPLPGLTAADVARSTELLLGSGASIDELNAVRKHLCEVGGGRLACRAGAARLELWVVSDVLGDRLDVIGSGPCSPDPSRYADALAVVERRGLDGRMPPRALAALRAGARGEREESVKPGHPAFGRVRARILVRNRDALAAAEAEGARLGLACLRVSEQLRGEARVAGRRIAALARSLGRRAARPLLLSAGGETTVTLRGPGRGGRSQELALAAALEWAGDQGQALALLAAGTDGSDGPTDAAGAHADPGSAARGSARGADAGAALARNDSFGFFSREGGLFRTGPTGTNVMDLVLVRVG